jgi:hypothetical protein
MSGSAASCWAATSSETANPAREIRWAATYSSKSVTSFAATPSGGAGGGFTSAIAVSECSSGGIAGTNPRARRFVASPIGRQDGPTVHVERVWPFSATSRRACSIVSSSPSSVVRISETLDWVGPSVNTKAGTRTRRTGTAWSGRNRSGLQRVAERVPKMSSSPRVSHRAGPWATAMPTSGASESRCRLTMPRLSRRLDSWT